MLLFEEWSMLAFNFKRLTLNLLNKLQISVILFDIKLSFIYVMVLTIGEQAVTVSLYLTWVWKWNGTCEYQHDIV